MISTQLKLVASIAVAASMLTLSGSALAQDAKPAAKAAMGDQRGSTMANQAMSKLSKEEQAAVRAMVKSETAAFLKGGAELGNDHGSVMATQAASKLSKEEMAALRSMIRMEAVKSARKDMARNN